MTTDILIVDNDPQSRSWLTHLLGSHDCSCATAANAQEGRERLGEEEFYLAFCDVSMPEGSGLDLARHILTEHPDTAVMVSGPGDTETASAALVMGAYGYIIRPFKQQEVLINVVNALHRHKLEVEARVLWEKAAQTMFKNAAVLQRSRDQRETAEQALREANTETEELLAAIPSILINMDADGIIRQWNHAAEGAFGIQAACAIGKTLRECDIDWSSSDSLDQLADALSKGQRQQLPDIRFRRSDDKERILGISVNPLSERKGIRSGFLIFGADVTERRMLEVQLHQAQKLESIGQLAAGIAHEINTPTQYVGDNTRFLKESFGDLVKVLKRYQDLLQASRAGNVSAELVAEVEATANQADLAYLTDEIPKAIQASLEGVERVARIVQSMKEFAHPGTAEKTPADLNKAIASTIWVARHEWKYVAEMVTDFDPNLPQVPCLLADFNQVILNMIINAAHAISDVQDQPGKEKGTITIRTRHNDDWVEIRISDTGTGIPEAIRARIFDPFFTTKEVGKGTGQGLAISHSVIVDKHEGSITLETELGRGTTFILRLPT